MAKWNYRIHKRNIYINLPGSIFFRCLHSRIWRHSGTAGTSWLWIPYSSPALWDLAPALSALCPDCPGYSASTEAFTAFERHSFLSSGACFRRTQSRRYRRPRRTVQKRMLPLFQKIYADDHLRLPAVYTDSEQYSTSYGRGEYYYDCRTCRIFLTGILWPDFQALHGHVTQSV